MDLNKVMVIGRLTRDPELRSIPSGQAVASVGVATGRTWNDKDGQRQQQTEFHNVVLWRRLAEIASQYLHKGSKVYIEGRLQTREWTAQDGGKRSRTEIVAENLIMLDSKGAGGGSYSSSASSPAPTVSQGPEEVIEEEVKVEDIPF